MHWLDRDMVGRSRAFIEDEIAIRIDHHETTLRKHGIKTFLGSLASTLDSKALLAGPAAIAALSYAGDPKWALIAGASIIVGKVAVHIATSTLEYREIESGAEIAYLVELKQ